MKRFFEKISYSPLALAVFAAGDSTPIDIGPKAGTQWALLRNLTMASVVSGFIRLLLLVSALVFFFFLLWGGIKWIMSQGDKGEVEKARNQITNALIGLVIIFVAWAIIKLIEALFGINIMSLDIPSLQS